ncbi:hypothetical protein H7100_02365 [Candidatus Saccharibacteria bacterium]|nr:hypothetical protein [Candidatus Saccharibacteria bacterium]
MTESFHESAAYERDRSLDGLIEVAYDDAHAIVLDIAEVLPTTIRKEGLNVPYDILMTRDGYVLEPYTVYNWEEISRFGSELHGVVLPDRKTGIQSKKHSDNLGFIALIQTFNQDDIEALTTIVQIEHRDDAISYAMLHRELKDQRYDLWLRLKQKQHAKHVEDEPIVARLEYIGFSGDKLTMIPHIKNTNGHQVDYIPEQLTLGDPWLYVGVDYNPESDEE